jgi:hypothetical protein
VLSDSNLNPHVKTQDRLARLQAPKNRAVHLGNNDTGKDFNQESFQRVNVVRRTTVWDTTTALVNYVQAKYGNKLK